MEILFIFLLIGIFLYFLLKKTQKKNPENEFGKKTVQFIEDSVNYTNHNLIKIKKNIEKSTTLNYISNTTWFLTNSNNNLEILYNFLNDGTLLISENGIVQRYKFELIVDNNSLLITKNDIKELYDIINTENNFLYLHKISTRENLNFINKTKIKDKIKEFIEIENQEQNKNLRNEVQKYKFEPKNDFTFISFINQWEYNNPGKTSIDYINFLENKSNINYNTWLRYNPGKSILEFGEYLHERFGEKLK